MVNVDLLIANDHGETLLTWRDDEYYGPGWHIPGGIIRFKETAAARISQVAHLELGTQVLAAATPELVSEIMAQHRDTRGHFISLLYRCQLIAPPNEEMKYNGRKLTNGAWHWFGYCPENLIPAHNIYRPYIGTI